MKKSVLLTISILAILGFVACTPKTTHTIERVVNMPVTPSAPGAPTIAGGSGTGGGGVNPTAPIIPNPAPAPGVGGESNGGGNAAGEEFFDFYENNGTEIIENMEDLPVFKSEVEPILNKLDEDWRFFEFAMVMDSTYFDGQNWNAFLRANILKDFCGSDRVLDFSKCKWDQQKSYGLGKALRLAVKSMRWLLESKPLSGTCLNRSMITDSTLAVVGCQDDAEVRLSKTWMKKASPKNQAGLIIHEALLILARKLLSPQSPGYEIAKQASEKGVRKINRYIFGNLDKISTKDFMDLVSYVLGIPDLIPKEGLDFYYKILGTKNSFLCAQEDLNPDNQHDYLKANIAKELEKTELFQLPLGSESNKSIALNKWGFYPFSINSYVQNRMPGLVRSLITGPLFKIEKTPPVPSYAGDSSIKQKILDFESANEKARAQNKKFFEEVCHRPYVEAN